MAKWRELKMQSKPGYVNLEAVVAMIPNKGRPGYTRLLLVGGSEVIAKGEPVDFVTDD